VSSSSSVRRRLRHDLNNPLSVIVGRCDMLLQEAHGPISDEQRRALEAVLRSAERLQSEIHQLAVDYDLEHPPPASST
jgi:signal transduction histidine kinase